MVHGQLQNRVILMLVLHTAKLANRQAFAGGQQFLVAHVFFLARLQALGRAFVGGSNGAVPGNVFFGFLVAVRISRYTNGSATRNGYEG
jgi:hypothetical protein